MKIFANFTKFQQKQNNNDLLLYLPVMILFATFLGELMSSQSGSLTLFDNFDFVLDVYLFIIQFQTLSFILIN